MSPTFAFFTFLNAFWIMAFIAIPFSVEYAPEQKESAPKAIRWKKLITIAALLAVLVTASLSLIIKSGLIVVR